MFTFMDWGLQTIFVVNSLRLLIASPLKLFRGTYFVLTFAPGSEYVKLMQFRC